MRSASPRRRLRCEPLESRETPAGTVTAVQVGTTLTLTGDDDANVVQLSQSAAGIEVLGFNNTTIVGGPTFAGVSSVKTLMKDGDDNVFINSTADFALAGTATFDLGDGDNNLSLVTGEKITLAGLTVAAGDGKDTVTIAGGLGKGSQVTGNVSISVGIGRGDQNNELGTISTTTVRNIDLLGLGGLKYTAADGNEELIFEGVTVSRALNANGGEGSLWVTTTGGSYGSVALSSVGFGIGNPFRGVSFTGDGTSVTGTVAVKCRFGIVLDWTGMTTGPVSVVAGPQGVAGADFHGANVIHGNFTIRGFNPHVQALVGSAVTIDGDFLATAVTEASFGAREATLAVRNVSLTGGAGAHFGLFGSNQAPNSHATVAGTMTLRAPSVDYGQTGGEVTIGGRLALFGTTSASFTTGAESFEFDAQPAKTTAASLLVQARSARYSQTESEATFDGGLSVIGTEEANFESIPREQNEDPGNPGVFDSAAGAITSVAHGNVLIRSQGQTSYYQAEGVATYGGLSAIGGSPTGSGFADVFIEVGEGFMSIGPKLSVTTGPALIQGPAADYVQVGGEATFAAGLSILGKEDGQFVTMTGETHDQQFNFFDRPAKLTVTTGPLKVSGGIGDVQFDAGGEFLHAGGDVLISGTGHNRISFDPTSGTTVGGSLKVSGATGDPDFFGADTDLTVAKDLSVSLGGGANSIGFDGTTTVGGNLTLVGGNGSDDFSLTGLIVSGTTTVITGAGADTLAIGASTFAGAVSVDLGAGEDTLAIADVPTASAPVTFNSAATFKMGTGNDGLTLGLALASGGNANTNVLFGPTGSLKVDGGSSLNLFDDETGQFDAAKVTVLNFTDPTP